MKDGVTPGETADVLPFFFYGFHFRETSVDTSF